MLMATLYKKEVILNKLFTETTCNQNIMRL